MSQITIPREELEQVLEALESCAVIVPRSQYEKADDAISTLRARLAEQRPEPVAQIVKTAPKQIWLNIFTDGEEDLPFPGNHEGITWCEDEVGDADVKYIRADLASPPPRPSPALSVVHEQAEDEGLWFKAQTAPEAYLQQELRRLHAAVESEPRPELSEGEIRECFTSTNTREPLEDGWPGLLRFGRAIERKVRNG